MVLKGRGGPHLHIGGGVEPPVLGAGVSWWRPHEQGGVLRPRPASVGANKAEPCCWTSTGEGHASAEARRSRQRGVQAPSAPAP